MKKLACSVLVIAGLSGCTSQEIAQFTQVLTQPITKKSEKLKTSEQVKQTATDPNSHVIRVKKNPNKGKKKVVIGGMDLPSSYSYDEDGELQWTPKTTDRDIREYNRILKGTGIKIEGY